MRAHILPLKQKMMVEGSSSQKTRGNQQPDRHPLPYSKVRPLRTRNARLYLRSGTTRVGLERCMGSGLASTKGIDPAKSRLSVASGRGRSSWDYLVDATRREHPRLAETEAKPLHAHVTAQIRHLHFPECLEFPQGIQSFQDADCHASSRSK